MQPSIKSDASVPPVREDRKAEALRMARRICEERGLRLTTLRQAALVAIASSDRPLGAYHLSSLLDESLGKRVAPPTVYRALDFLLQSGLIARVESRNAYILCEKPERAGRSVVFLCNRCDASTKVADIGLEQLIEADAATVGFQIDKPIIECSGTCRACADKSATATSLEKPVPSTGNAS